MNFNRFAIRFFANIVVAVLLFGCSGTPEPAEVVTAERETDVSPSEPDSPEPEAEEPSVEEPVVVPDEPVLEEEQFTPEDVTEELYDQTFTEVEATIIELNEIISSRDFARWQTYLTADYRRTYSDPRVLEESSQSAVLRRNNIVLQTLEDYFQYVVVPSRANLRLDEIVFVDTETVEAIMEVEGTKYLLYNLTKAGDRWKIDTF